MATKKQKKKYIKWYRVAEEVLGDLLPHITKEDIINKVSNNDWLMLPISEKETRREGINRKAPNIYFGLWEEEKIHIGLTANNIPTVDRLENILKAVHHEEKERLLSEMKKLGDDFETRLQKKIKENYFAESPSYETLDKIKTNEIDEDFIEKIFRTIKEVKKRGREKRKNENLSFNPEAPVVNLAKVDIPKNEREFREKLSQIKPLYETCLNIKWGKKLETAREEKKEDLRMERKLLLRKARSTNSQKEKERYYSRKKEIDEKLKKLK